MAVNGTPLRDKQTPGQVRPANEAVLESGDRLVATARDPRRLDDLVKKYGDRVRAVPLDVTDEGAAQAAVRMAVATFERLDVVVNKRRVRRYRAVRTIERGEVQSGDGYQLLWRG